MSRTASDIIAGRSFSEFFNTASDEDKKELFMLVTQNANKQQRKLMDDFTDKLNKKIANDQKYM